MPKSGDHGVLTKQEERRLIEAGRGVLLSGGFPNPDRAGCPQSDVLKAIAFRRMPLTEATRYIDHVGSCSPCFIAYAAFQKHAQRRKTLELVLASAALLILATVGAWLWRAHSFHGTGGSVATNVPYQKVMVDLRNRLILRGEEGTPANSGPIELPRGRLDLTLLLPKGSEPGNYTVGISTEVERSVMTAMGVAMNQNGITALNVKLDTAKLNSGTYLLAIGPERGEQREYPLVVKQ
jgi:hypothetical protein